MFNDPLFKPFTVTAFACLFVAAVVATGAETGTAAKYGTITEKTPSIPQYFSWINNTNEGPTEAQTLTNLQFFKWLHEEYGMRLGIYAFDAGTIDSQNYYGRMDTERFKSQFPDGFGRVAELARSFDCRLGLWGGPDGFGDTPQEEKARTEMLVSLCRDYGFRLFKLDAVCGQLRDDKQDAFANAMAACRKHAPDLVVLNHRLKLNEESRRHMTTFLWGGRETYIDVHMANGNTATHNRAAALGRGLPPDLQRLTEDHGVCLSSCLDFWEDDLILQGFSRSLILAPQIYGNPWLLRDDEFPKLARIYNLHYRNRQILVDGMTLPPKYGEYAAARGDASTRFVTLRNLTWNPIQYTIQLDEEIGLTEKGRVEVRRYHPSEYILGDFEYGDTVAVTVDPFRSCLVMATVRPCEEIGVRGCAYEIVRDVPNKPAKVKLLGLPGTTANVELWAGSRKFERATIAGKSVADLLDGEAAVNFPGEPVDENWHRKRAELAAVPVPDDAEQLYEATCFAAPNDALEVQSLRRSGPSNIPQVSAARKALFEQELFWRRGIWNKYLFDGNDETFFSVFHYRRDKRISGGCLRVDFGRARTADAIRIKTLWDAEGGAELPRRMSAEISNNLKAWQPIVFERTSSERRKQVKVAQIENNGGKHEYAGLDLLSWEADVPSDASFRYLRLAPAPQRTAEVEIFENGARKQIGETGRHATVLFAAYEQAKAELAWQASVSIAPNPAAGSYLCVALNGEHGANGAFAALRCGDSWIGATQRAVSFPAVVFEYGPSNRTANYTYFFPITREMRGKDLDIVVLGQAGCKPELEAEAWTTVYPNPYTSVEVTLE
jgi:hypothetical protein